MHSAQVSLVLAVLQIVGTWVLLGVVAALYMWWSARRALEALRRWLLERDYELVGHRRLWWERSRAPIALYFTAKDVDRSGRSGCAFVSGLRRPRVDVLWEDGVDTRDGRFPVITAAGHRPSNQSSVA